MYTKNCMEPCNRWKTQIYCMWANHFAFCTKKVPWKRMAFDGIGSRWILSCAHCEAGCWAWAPGWYHENGNYYPKTQEPEVAGNSGFLLTFIYHHLSLERPIICDMFRFPSSWEVAGFWYRWYHLGAAQLVTVARASAQVQHSAAVDGSLFQVVGVGGVTKRQIFHTIPKKNDVFAALFGKAQQGEVWDMKASDSKGGTKVCVLPDVCVWLITWATTLAGCKFPDEMTRLPSNFLAG